MRHHYYLTPIERMQGRRVLADFLMICAYFNTYFDIYFLVCPGSIPVPFKLRPPKSPIFHRILSVDLFPSPAESVEESVEV